MDRGIRGTLEMQTQATVEVPDELDAAVGAWIESGQAGDPAPYLQQQGVDLPADAQVTVRALPSSDDAGKAPKKTCHEVCVNIGIVKYCYERCR